MDIIAHRHVGQAHVFVVQGDLTGQPVEAVVNAANENLAHGGGVAAAIVGLVRKGLPDMRVELASCNSAPVLLVYSGDVLDLVIAVEIVDGLITNFYAVRNPDKLTAVAVPRQISR